MALGHKGERNVEETWDQNPDVHWVLSYIRYTWKEMPTENAQFKLTCRYVTVFKAFLL